MRIETDLDGAVVGAIERHYMSAKERHPYFCDMITPNWITQDERDFTIAKRLTDLRRQIQEQVKRSCVMWDTLLECETWEAHEAIAIGHPELAVDECYDAIAVLLRVIDVLQGRQALGRQKESEVAR